WRARVLTSWSDKDIGAILGVDRDADFGTAEREHPDAMLIVTTRSLGPAHSPFVSGALVRVAAGGRWRGQANSLSADHLDHWPVIDEVAQACAKPETPDIFWQAPTLPEAVSRPGTHLAIDIIKQRRSAQTFDGRSSISASTFYRMLDMTLPRRNVPPWDSIGWEPRVHLALLIHRVEGLTPGLYVFLRNPHGAATLHAEFSRTFDWMQVADCPAHLLLFRLETADARNAARTLSCHQDIAADGAFSFGMLAEYETSLAQGPWVYRQLFWEAGILGQVLYLEAEAAGVRSTGIGCYFDDAVHDLLGIKGMALQSLYHFTVGTALTDTRLQTLPAYTHLKR
ncbi:MAG: SagB/ThcOx family dehydrogenase, partial [Planctomycetota bacterium]